MRVQEKLKESHHSQVFHKKKAGAVKSSRLKKSGWVDPKAIPPKLD
jgi:hypothetical protein